MKALRWHARKDLRYEEVPEPTPGPGQLKVEVRLAGICGTDLKEYSEGPVMIPPEAGPVILGHEFVGTVVELGEGASGFAIGDRVTGLCNWYCGNCAYCRSGMYNLCKNTAFTGLSEAGCMAEYMVAPSKTLYGLPDSVSDEDGVLVEPLSVAVHAVRLGGVGPGKTVAVVGEGAIGLCAVLAAKAAGARAVYVVAKHKGRGEKALLLGANKVLYVGTNDPASEMIGMNEGLGVDVSMECVGRPDTPQLAVSLLRSNGVAVIVGVFSQPSNFHFASIVFNQITVVGSPIYVDEAKAVIALLADKRIDPKGLVTSKIPLRDAAELGFENLLNNKEENVKVLLQIR
jgi:(R,R)-butanediol dehydrogenase/meso-butanediol dehydrogenase/diacetyl reductase